MIHRAMGISSDPPRIHEEQSRPPPLPVSEYVVSYATPQPANRAAALSMVFGLLLFIPFVPGVLAVVLGRRGLKMASEQAAGHDRMARVGIMLGVLNLVLSLSAAATVPGAYMRAQRARMTVQCASNLRSIGVAVMMYSISNKGFLPPTVDDIAAMMPGASGAGAFICPASGSNPAKPPVLKTSNITSHYYYIPPAAKITQIKRPSSTVIAYEPPGHHDRGGMNLLFADGHVEFVTGSSVTKIAAELAAGQNPPPSKP